MYKVVKKVGVAATELVSPIAPRRRTYTPDQWTRPEIGKLFVFDNPYHSMLFIESQREVWSYEIWEIEIEGKPEEPLYLPNPYFALNDQIDYYWRNECWRTGEDCVGEHWRTAEGTLLVDAVKLLRRAA